MLKRILKAALALMIAAAVSGGSVFYLHVKVHSAYEEQQHAAAERSKNTVEQIAAYLKTHANVIKRSSITMPSSSQQYAVIHCDVRGFEKPLYFGDSNYILDIGIGQYEKSGIPGGGKPLLLAGHNGTHFYLLPKFENGDIVQIDTAYGSFQYEVYDSEIKNAAAFDVSTLDRDEEELIMYTCYPFDVAITPLRYFVYARLVDGPVIEED